MIIAVIVIWIVFNILSGGDFLTARNLWNLSVQSTSIAIMATGMVLIIVSRNIDLSVGSLLGFLGYVMALVQTDGVIAFFNISIDLGSIGDSSWIWVIALVVGISMGAVVGAVQGFIIAYGGVPAFIVTLGGFLDLARHDLPDRRQAGPDARPAQRHLPVVRWRPGRIARRLEELAVRLLSAAR